MSDLEMGGNGGGLQRSSLIGSRFPHTSSNAIMLDYGMEYCLVEANSEVGETVCGLGSDSLSTFAEVQRRGVVW